MTPVEAILLFLLALFPVIDWLLDKYWQSTKQTEYVKTAAMLWLVCGFLLFCWYQDTLTVSRFNLVLWPTEEYGVYLLFTTFLCKHTKIAKSLASIQAGFLFVSTHE